MAFDFKDWDRNQLMLLPPDLAAWLPDDHLALFVLEAVDRCDLSAFFKGRRADGAGRPAYHPQMLVSLLVYAYCIGMVSSRKIETACRDRVPFRVICANQVPDHSTICRFRQAFTNEVVRLFVEVLVLCRQAGLAKVGTVAVDGTKVAADAALSSNRTYAKICEEFEQTVTDLVEEAAAMDAAENRRLGDRRSDDELPDELADPTSRAGRLADAKRQLEEAKQAEQDAYQAHLEQRAAQEAELGRKLRGRKPKDPGTVPEAGAKANVTDPDSRIMKNGRGNFVQGYNGQAVVNEAQIVLAAELTQQANDVRQLHPMLDTLTDTLDAAGIDQDPEVMLADAGYCSEANLTDHDDGPDLLVATTKRHKLDAAAPDTAEDDDPEGDQLSAVQQMARTLATDDDAQAAYDQRGWMIEGVFGQVKQGRGIRRLPRRGLDACRADWLLILACHNLVKLWRHTRTGGRQPPTGSLALVA